MLLVPALVPTSVRELQRVGVLFRHWERLAAHRPVRSTALTIVRCRRPSASQAAQRPEGSALTRRWDTTTRYPCVGKQIADLPSGERANAFTNDEKLDYRYEQNTACEQHYARSSP